MAPQHCLSVRCQSENYSFSIILLGFLSSISSTSDIQEMRRYRLVQGSEGTKPAISFFSSSSLIKPCKKEVLAEANQIPCLLDCHKIAGSFFASFQAILHKRNRKKSHRVDKHIHMAVIFDISNAMCLLPGL